jgi:hypothetical protein
MQTLADDDVNMSISIRLFIITPAALSKAFYVQEMKIL